MGGNALNYLLALATAATISLGGLTFATAIGHASGEDLAKVEKESKARDAKLEKALEKLQATVDAQGIAAAEYRGLVKGKLGIKEEKK